jgi:hypothetical protein
MMDGEQGMKCSGDQDLVATQAIARLGWISAGTWCTGSTQGPLMATLYARDSRIAEVQM